MSTPSISLQTDAASSSIRWPPFNTSCARVFFALRSVWSHIPRGWWLMPGVGFGLLMMLACGHGLPWFVGKYALTGKDFQEVLGPSLLAAAMVVAVYLWLIERHPSRAWMICLPTALLCREIHFSGTGTGIYVALALIGIYSLRHRRLLQPVWECQPITCLWLGACTWYALAVSVDSGAWKFLPHSHWWSVNLEETLESGGHLAILLGVLASVMMVVRRPRMSYNKAAVQPQSK
jgi:hypothetical protein